MSEGKLNGGLFGLANDLAVQLRDLPLESPPFSSKTKNQLWSEQAVATIQMFCLHYGDHSIGINTTDRGFKFIKGDTFFLIEAMSFADDFGVLLTRQSKPNKVFCRGPEDEASDSPELKQRNFFQRTNKFAFACVRLFYSEKDFRLSQSMRPPAPLSTALPAPVSVPVPLENKFSGIHQSILSFGAATVAVMEDRTLLEGTPSVILRALTCHAARDIVEFLIKEGAESPLLGIPGVNRIRECLSRTRHQSLQDLFTIVACLAQYGAENPQVLMEDALRNLENIRRTTSSDFTSEKSLRLG